MKFMILVAALLVPVAAHAQTAASPPPFNFINHPPGAVPTDAGGAGGAAVRASQRRGALPGAHRAHHRHMRVR